MTATRAIFLAGALALVAAGRVDNTHGGALDGLLRKGPAVLRIFDDGELSKGTEYDFIVAASRFDDSAVRFANLNYTADPAAAARLGVPSAAELPAFVLARPGAGHVRFSGNPTSDGLVSFVEGEAGVAASPSLVRKLSDAEFDKVVFNPKLHVFVEFYAPWCFHCKRLAYDWEQLARAFAAERNVVIAKVDATEARKATSDSKVRGYPSLVYFPASSKRQRVKYEGDRSLDGLVRFVNQRAGTFRAPDGGMSDDAGLVPSLSPLARAFLAHTPADRQAAATAAREAADAFVEAAAEGAERRAARTTVRAYLEVFESAEADVRAWVASEKTAIVDKLQRAQAGSAMHMALRKRQNVLRQFLPDPLDLGKVVSLDSGSFERLVDGSRPAMVEFFAPWCPHCQRLEPEYAEVAREIGGKGDLLIASVDTTDNRELSQRFDIKGLPTIMFFPPSGRAPAGKDDGEVYRGERVKSPMVSFLRSKLRALRRDEL